MCFFLCFHTFPRRYVASWPLQFISLCWLSFAGFFFTVYESMEKSRKSLPRISTSRSFMSSSDGVSRHIASDDLAQRSLKRTKLRHECSYFLAINAKAIGFQSQSVLQKNSQSSRFLLKWRIIIRRSLRITILRLIYFCLLYKWLPFAHITLDMPRSTS